jgi:hypothetical protein
MKDVDAGTFWSGLQMEDWRADIPEFSMNLRNEFGILDIYGAD